MNKLKKKTLNFFIMITKMYLCLCVPTESTKIKPSQILVIPQHIASVFRLEVVTQTKKNSKYLLQIQLHV